MDFSNSYFKTPKPIKPVNTKISAATLMIRFSMLNVDHDECRFGSGRVIK
jgi:hypothetical protein